MYQEWAHRRPFVREFPIQFWVDLALKLSRTNICRSIFWAALLFQVSFPGKFFTISWSQWLCGFCFLHDVWVIQADLSERQSSWGAESVADNYEGVRMRLGASEKYACSWSVMDGCSLSLECTLIVLYSAVSISILPFYVSILFLENRFSFYC